MSTFLTPADVERMTRDELLHLADYCDWYHLVDLGPKVTPNATFDMRPLLAKYGFPEDLSGKRVLDLGRASGFFSFEFERRGAAVTATDLPDRAGKDYVGGDFTNEFFRRRLEYGRQLIAERAREGRPYTIEEINHGNHLGFWVARKLLNSSVKPVELALSDLTLEAVGGQPFDMVFAGSILNHVMDPVASLQRIFRVTGDLFVLANPIAADDSDTPRMQLVGRSSRKLTTWWLPNIACLTQMVACVGFEDVRVVSSDLMVRGTGGKILHAVIHARRPRDEEAAIKRWGDIVTGGK